MALRTYNSAALEENGFMARSFAVSKCAYRLGRLIRVCGDEIIQPFAPELFKKPFAVKGWISSFKPYALKRDGLVYIYGPGSPSNALKHRLVSSMSTGPWTYKDQL